MSVLVYGLSYNTAPLELREQVAFTQEVLPYALKEAQAKLVVPEVSILSTCNRTEIYCYYDNNTHQDSYKHKLAHWLTDFHQIEDDNLSSACYYYQNKQAIKHSIRVASGLDSMIIGEPQILGQVKCAYRTAQQTATTGPILNQLAQHSIAAAKHIRSTTQISRNPVTIAYATLKLARQIFAAISDCNILLVGAGEIVELMVQHFQSAGAKHIVIANRTLQNAQQLASNFAVEAVTLGELREHLNQADIVVTSTGSQTPLVGKGMVEEALRQRRYKPVLMVDLAVPRDIEPEVGRLANAYLYTIDDLKEIISVGNQARTEAAIAAESMVNDAADGFINYLKGRNATTTIQLLRAQAEHTAQQELDKATAQLNKGADPYKVIQRLSRTLTNKWLHNPTVKLREAMAVNQLELLDAAFNLHNLQQTDPVDKL